MRRVDAEPTARLVMAQTLVDNRQSNRRIELHAVHPPPLVATDKGPWLAHFRAAATGPSGSLRVEHYSSAVNTSERRMPV